MSRSRMFRNDEPPAEVPSPRTTIVGGRPPEDGATLPPVPTGLPRLLRLAAVDEKFRGELLARRDAVAAAAGVELTASEQAILRAVPAAQLTGMIAGLPPPTADRRGFLREAAASAVLLLGGAALSACTPSGGARPDVPPVPDEPRPRRRDMEAEGGAAPDEPPPRADAGVPRPRHDEMMRTGGANPDVPRPRHNESGAKGGAREDVPPDPAQVPIGGLTTDRPAHRFQAPGGAAPDVPRPPRPPTKPDGGPR
ncbi:MAG TPA: hypothetical protein VGQ83_13250 [Polyangia bacterium]|jgi:hypothetical protein